MLSTFTSETFCEGDSFTVYVGEEQMWTYTDGSVNGHTTWTDGRSRE